MSEKTDCQANSGQQIHCYATRSRSQCSPQQDRSSRLSTRQTTNIKPSRKPNNCGYSSRSKGHISTGTPGTQPEPNQSNQAHDIRPRSQTSSPHQQCEDLDERPTAKHHRPGSPRFPRTTTLRTRTHSLLQVSEVRTHPENLHTELPLQSMRSKSCNRGLPKQKEGWTGHLTQMSQLQRPPLGGFTGLSSQKAKGSRDNSTLPSQPVSSSSSTITSLSNSTSTNRHSKLPIPFTSSSHSNSTDCDPSRYQRPTPENHHSCYRTNHLPHPIGQDTHRFHPKQDSGNHHYYDLNSANLEKPTANPASEPTTSNPCHQPTERNTSRFDYKSKQSCPQETQRTSSQQSEEENTKRNQHHLPGSTVYRDRPQSPSIQPSGGHVSLTSTIQRLKSRLHNQDNENIPSPTQDIPSTTPSSSQRPSQENSPNGHRSSPSVLILQWNAQSIRSFAKQSYLIAAIKQLKPQVLLLQETNLPQDANFKIPGYNIYLAPGQRGLLTAVQTSIPSHRPKITQNFGRNIESLVIDILLEDHPIRLFNIYRNPNPTRNAKLDSAALLHYASLSPAVVAGDFNAHHPLWGTPAHRPPCQTGTQLADAILQSDMVIINDGSPTHQNLGRLDLTLVSTDLAPKSTWKINDSLASDHFSITTTLNISRGTTTTQSTSKLNFRKANWNSFQSYFAEFAPTYTAPQDLNQHNKDITDAFQTAAKRSIPSTKPTIPRKEAWYYSLEIKAAKNMVNQHVRLFRNHPTPGNRTLLREVLNHAREVAATERSAKWLQWCDGLNEHTSVSDMWRQLKRATGASTSTPLHPNPQHQAQVLNETFADRASNNILPQDTRDMLDNLKNLREDTITDAINSTNASTDRPFSMYELTRALRSSNSTPGHDNITHLMIKKAGLHGHQIILDLINHSYSSGKLPQQWKFADVVPIPKPKQPGVFRPISLISCLSKLAERMILNRLRWQFGPLHQNIFGFQPGRSTAHATSTLLHLATSQPASPALAAFIDLEKAFELANDTVISSLLAEKNVSGRLLKWTVDFLSQRQIRVKFQGKYSDYQILENGTPQGSVLSPFLFNVLMNSLVSLPLPDKVHTLSYADDIVVIAIGPHAPTLLQTSLRGLHYKLQCLGLKISLDKTKAMAFRAANPRRPLIIDNMPIEWVPVFQYLGINIDKELTLSPHIDYIQSRLTKRLNLMRALTSPEIGANAKVLRRFYTAAIRSIMDFAATSLIIAKPNLILKLDKLQNIALRIILGAPKWTKIKTMQKELTLLPVPLRLIQISSSFLLGLTRLTTPIILKTLLHANNDYLNFPITTWAKQAKFQLRSFLPSALESTDLPVRPDPPPWICPSANFCIALP